MEQLRNNRSHTSKVSRPRSTIQPVADPGHDYLRYSALRIHLRCVRSTQHLNSLRLQRSAVGLKRPRIPREILPRTKLKRVHKNGRGHDIAFAPCSPHHRQMPFMQSTHRRHKAEHTPRRTNLPADALHLRNACYNSHNRKISLTAPQPELPSPRASPAKGDNSPHPTETSAPQPRVCTLRVPRALRSRHLHTAAQI